MSIPPILIPNEGAISNLQDWILGDLASAVVRLYDMSVVYNPSLTVADFHEATFVGYLPVVVGAWSPPFINGDGKAETDSPPITFTYGGAVGTALLYGMFLTDLAGTKLLAVSPFSPPITLTPTVPSISRLVKLTAISEL